MVRRDRPGQTETAMNSLINELTTLEPTVDDDGNLVPRALPLTPEAKAMWIEYFNRHRQEQADLDDDLAAAWSKLEAYTARFALVFQLCSAAASGTTAHAVDRAHLEAAIAVSDWFGHEATRVYTMLRETDEQRDQRRLVEWLQRRGDPATAREVQQCCRWLKNSARQKQPWRRW